MLARLEHPLKAEYSIDVTPLGISMLVRLEHPSKALLPIDVSCEFSPNVTFVRLEQFLKA